MIFGWSDKFIYNFEANTLVKTDVGFYVGCNMNRVIQTDRKKTKLVTVNAKNEITVYDFIEDKFTTQEIELFLIDDDPELTAELERQAKEYLIKENEITLEEAQIGGAFELPPDWVAKNS